MPGPMHVRERAYRGATFRSHARVGALGLALLLSAWTGEVSAEPQSAELPSTKPRSAGVPSTKATARAKDSEAPPTNTEEGKGPRHLPVLTPSAQYYLRSQGRYNVDQDPAPGDRQHNIYQRVRVGLLGAVGPVRAFIQVSDVREWGFETSTVSNQANIDLYQGYLEIQSSKGGKKGGLRVGRQMLQVGSSRLIGARIWNSVGQSFDALRAYGSLGRFSADLGLMMLSRPQVFTAGEQIQTRGSYAAYLQLRADLWPQLAIETLTIGLSERPTPSATTLERDIITSGLRLVGDPLRGVHYDIEAYGQFGQNLGLRHRAWALVSELAYTSESKLRPGGYLRYHYASGQGCTGTPDEGCGNGESHEFLRLFGLRHAFYGVMDRVALSNLRELELAATMQAHRTVNLSLSYHFFQLDKPTGIWRDGPGRAVGVGWDPTNKSRDLGQEIEFIANIRPFTANVRIQPGYAVFLPLAGGRRLSGPAAQHFVYLWLTAEF
ncbi:MAG TPA: hypothetical protein ENJ18_14680 [Nannocystis exedens]|nr:hypothetical protein [Nannocystis exedens]